jgi:hypothetical protein
MKDLCLLTIDTLKLELEGANRKKGLYAPESFVNSRGLQLFLSWLDLANHLLSPMSLFVNFYGAFAYPSLS